MPCGVNGAAGPAHWDAVDWRRAEKCVRNLRRRIFRASRQGDLANVRSLQKLMLRSRANALVSVRRVTQRSKGKRTAGLDRQVVTMLDVAIRGIGDHWHDQVLPVDFVVIENTLGKFGRRTREFNKVPRDCQPLIGSGL